MASVEDKNIAYSDVDSQMWEFARSVEMNERVMQQLQDYELMLLDAESLPALLDVLLRATREHFKLSTVTVTLYDPEGDIEELLPKDLVYGGDLQMVQDSFDLQQLYGVSPQIEVVDMVDPRAKQALEIDAGVERLVLMPLLRDGNLVGSFQWGSSEGSTFNTSVELDFIAHLASIIGICLENCINSERLSQLSLLDPVTRLSNRRAFGMELRKEISRAHRNQKSLTLLMMQVDDFRNISDSYGHLSSDHVLKNIGLNMSVMLRNTDCIGRCAEDRFGVLLPACSEAKGQEISERMRSETEFMEIDDGRGANLFASLAIGMTSWNPQNYPAVNMEKLAHHMMNSAEQAMQKAARAGGNRVSLSRLTTLIL